MELSYASYRRLEPDRILALWAAVLWLALGALAGAQTTPPNNYYDTAIGKTGATLKTALHNIIKGQTQLPYTSSSIDTWDALHNVDQDPADPTKVVLIYSGLSDLISQQDNGSSGTWNREHLWPQSFGLERLKTDSRAKTDVFNLRPCNIGANSSRGNKPYDATTPPGSTNAGAPGSTFDSDSWEPRDGDKGDICRSLFYMDVRYDGSDADVPDLELTDTLPLVTSQNKMGKLSTLLAWNRKFAVTDHERLRNQRIYTSYQFNRNPFVDHPEFADMVFSNTTHLQSWKSLRFTAIELANTGVSGDAADADGDSVPNLVEYKFHRNPRTQEAAPLFQVSRAANGRLQLVLSEDRFATDVTISYETSTDLHAWAPITPTSTTTTVISYEVEQITAQFSGAPEACFVRAKLVSP